MKNRLIAVIDDLEMIRELIKDYLINAGHENVLSFDDPSKALETLKGREDLALVITDYEMPGLNGAQVIEAIKILHPGAHGIIVTGNVEAKKGLQEKYDVVQKGDPGFFQELLRLVENALGKRGGA